MKTKAESSEETRLANEIVAVLPAGSIARFCSDDAESIRFAVQSADLKLRRIVLARSSLRRLLADAARAVKVEYLQRDLLRSAMRRADFRYPRINEVLKAIRGRRDRKNAGAVATAAVR